MDYKALMDAKKAEDAIKESKVSLTKKIEEALKEIDNFMKFADEMPEPIHPIRYEKLLKEIKKTLES